MVRVRHIPRLLAVLIAIAPQSAVGQQRGLPSPQIAVAILEGGLSIRSAESGLGQPLIDLLAEDATFLWSGASFASGRDAAAVMLMALPQDVREAPVSIQAQHRRVSTDSTRVLEWGLWALAPAGPRKVPDLMRFLASWRLQAGSWRIELLALNGALGAPMVTDPSRTVERADALSGLVPALRAADSSFRAALSNEGVGAWRNWSHTTAVTFQGSGILNIGPEEISLGLEALTGATWQMSPEAGGGAEDGSLGWVAGRLEITRPGEAGGSASDWNYVLFWVLVDGEYRITAAGTNPRRRPGDD